MDCIQVLNIQVRNITEEQLLDGLNRNLRGEGGNGILVTPNLDHLIKLQSDEEFYRCYEQAEWVVCDSRVLWLCSKVLPRKINTTIPGSSFFTRFYLYHRNNESCRIFLLGGMGRVAQQAQQRINKKVGREIVVGAYSPSLGFESNDSENHEICRLIAASGANVVLVGVGAPKQEKWINKYRERLPEVKIWMALGATIDFEAGQKKRAPKWMQKLALEWFFRLCCEPRRMFRRYLIDDMQFFGYLLRQILGCYRNPFEHGK